MGKVWQGGMTQEERDREALLYAKRFIFLNRLVALTGLGRVLALLRAALSYGPLMLRMKLGRA